MILFVNQNIRFLPKNRNRLKKWISNVITSNEFKVGDISFVFCNDEFILQTNITYLNHNYYTDVITFNYCENNIISADIIISIDTVRSNSNLNNVSFNNELLRVIIHGILHLIGFDDVTKEKKDEMTKFENIYLSLPIIENIIL
jgi:rRNA maturation RNase YbeY